VGSEIFLTHLYLFWGQPSLLYGGYRVSSPGGLRSKAVELWPLSPTPSSAEVEERVKLYVFSLSVLGSTLFCFHITFPLFPLSMTLDVTVVWEMTQCSLVAPCQPCDTYTFKVLRVYAKSCCPNLLLLLLFHCI